MGSRRNILTVVEESLEDQMPTKIDAAKRRLEASSGASDPGPESTPAEVPSPDELRKVFRRFRRLMGAAGNPGTIPIEGALRSGWVISSGTVEGYGDELFHVVMLTNGALHYTSGPPTGDTVELTGKWFLGDSIPELEAKMPDTVAALLASEGIDWDEPPQA
jgi:hypothetical protein